MDVKERLVRDFYAARAVRDWDAVRGLLAADVVWRESEGDLDYSGHHHGRETVAALLEKFVEITGGTFVLEPRQLFSTAEHVAANVRWHADRDGTHVEGNDLAVYRIANGRISDAWFFPDGFDPEALAEVFAFAASE
jgi:ketosteroid isomerase-like protein